jgi:drug/metabolite transporter (DMT)-like permease
VIAILGGLGAAVCWAITSVFAQRASRLVGELSTFAWAAVIGFCIAAVPAAVALSSSPPGTATLVRLGLSGVLNVVGLTAQFGALRRGSVSVVVPIASAEGAIAALIAAIAGSHLRPGGWVGLAALLLGVLITAGSQWSEDDGSKEKLVPVGMAVFAALCFGAGIFLLGKGGQHAPLALAVVPPSLMGVLLVSLPMASTGRLASPRPALVWLLGVGVAEIVGFVSYVLGARHSVPIAAVLSAQYATISVLVGITILRERLVTAQVIGLLLTIGGVAVLSVLG